MGKGGTLVEQLPEILGKDILPDSPQEALLGSARLEKVTDHVQGNYSSNSIRQTFAALAADPTSPIARVESDYGYYRRPANQEGTGARSDDTSAPTSSTDSHSGSACDGQREEKFRSLFTRASRYENRFPVHVEHTAAVRQKAGVNKWKFPDVVALDWDPSRELQNEGVVLQRAMLEVNRSLGAQLFRLSRIELKVTLTLGTFREHFFQCLSNSMWSHSARLVVATRISDAILADELRRLGTSYGVQVQSFNLTEEELDALPSAGTIREWSDQEFEVRHMQQQSTLLSPGALKTELDWDHLQDMRNQPQVFKDIFAWIARCLQDARAYTFEKYQDLCRIEESPA